MALFALFLLVVVFPGVCLARPQNQDCGSTFCGHLNISYPFRLKNQPPQCGRRGLELECENNTTTTMVLRDGNKFSVQQISYENHTIRFVDMSLLDSDDCDSVPLSPIYFVYDSYYDGYSPYYEEREATPASSFIFVLNCTKLMKSSVYIDASRCTTKSNTSASLPSSFFYFVQANIPRSDMDEACTVEAEIPIMVESISGMSTLAIYNIISQGFWLEWDPYYVDRHKVSFKEHV